jgi:hypothetical protein
VVERYVDWITVRTAAYDGFAMPENLEEAWEEHVSVGGTVDRDALRSEIEEILGTDRYFDLSDRYSVAAWGAAGASLSIMLDVSTVVGGAAGFVYLFERIRDAVRARGEHTDSQAPPTEEPVEGEDRWAEEPVEGEDRRAEGAADWARSWLARCLSLEPESIRITTVEPIDHEFRVTLETKYGTFRIEPGPEGSHRLKRVAKRA